MLIHSRAMATNILTEAEKAYYQAYEEYIITSVQANVVKCTVWGLIAYIQKIIHQGTTSLSKSI